MGAALNITSLSYSFKRAVESVTSVSSDPLAGPSSRNTGSHENGTHSGALPSSPGGIAHGEIADPNASPPPAPGPSPAGRSLLAFGRDRHGRADRSPGPRSPTPRQCGVAGRASTSGAPYSRTRAPQEGGGRSHGLDGTHEIACL